jgi:hypothetical protein
VAKTDLATKTAQYQQLMSGKGPRSPITVIADPFADYSLTDFAEEAELLEVAGKAWGRRFVQARGFGRKGGGSWVSHNGDAPVAVVHPEKFLGSMTASAYVNFWHDYLLAGHLYAHMLGVPFVILAGFDDGIMVHTMQDPQMQHPKIGTRIHKRPDYDGVENLIVTLPRSEFKKVSSNGDAKKV